MSAPAGFVGFTASGTMPDLSTIYFPPSGTLITYPILYGDGSDAYTNHIFKLFDAAAYLYAAQVTPVLGTAKHYGLSSRPVTRSGGSFFSRTSDGLAFTGSVTVPATDEAKAVLDVPHGATLTKCSFGHDPNNASPPAGVKVIGSVYKRHLTTGALTLIVATTDPTTGGSYGASHMFDTAAVSEAIDRTAYVYLMLLTGETGAGSDFTTWWGFTWTATVTGIDDGVA